MTTAPSRARRVFSSTSVMSGTSASAGAMRPVEDLREAENDIVDIDGKTSRRARRSEAAPLHLVSAWASRQRLILG